MTQTLTFSIDNQAFHYSVEPQAITSFEVQSVPKAYRVTWHDQGLPCDLIRQYLAKNPKNLLLIDRQVLALFESELQLSPERVFTIDATEAVKTLDSALAVVDFLQQHAFTKGEQLIVVGGGITQDIGAFVSAIYKRGISWVYFPTTLLSMADSCIGGKAGVNYRGAKNQLAVFSAPSVVEIHPAFLASLDNAALASGLGEILKLCILGGQHCIDTFNRTVQQGRVQHVADYQTLIMLALSIKKAVVEVDEFELNQRRSMNYGHTLGHAIEALSQYQIPHGIAVVIGMALVNELSHQHGLLSAQDLTALNALCYDLLDDQVMTCLAEIGLDDMVELIQKDKKTVGQMTSFVFMAAVGQTRFVQLTLNPELLEAIRAVFHNVLTKAGQNHP